MDHDQSHAYETKVRYWSDYSRVFFDPKSIQPVPDAPGIVEGDWMTNQELFRRYDEACVLTRSLTFLVKYISLRIPSWWRAHYVSWSRSVTISRYSFVDVIFQYEFNAHS